MCFDPCFHTAQDDHGKSEWQFKAGFTRDSVHPPQTIPPAPKEVQLPPALPEVQLPPAPPARLEQPTVPHPEGVPMWPEGEPIRPEGETIPPVPSERLPKRRRNVAPLLNPTVPTRTTPAAAEVTPHPKRAKSSIRQDNRESDNIRSSGRKRRPVQRLIEAMTAEIDHLEIPGELFCLEALYPDRDTTDLDPLLAYKASSDPDTMYLHQAMKQPDRQQFQEAMIKEVEDQMSNGNFSIVHRSKVPRNHAILPAVWQMKRKGDIRTRAIKKHKARLNVDGSRMKKGIHYDETYSPVASWNSIRLLLIMSILNPYVTDS